MLFYTALILFFLVSAALAQVDRSGLSGTVIDPTVAQYRRPDVTAVKSDSGPRRETTTSSAGTYDIPRIAGRRFTRSSSKTTALKDSTFVDVLRNRRRTRILNASSKLREAPSGLKSQPAPAIGQNFRRPWYAH